MGGVPGWRRPTPKKDKLIDTPDGLGEPTRHPTDPTRRSKKPRVFLGPIGAANIVLADPKKRDALRDRYGIKAIEMEGYGVAEASWVANIGYLVVRGICDYCNSTKNDDWHGYAALIAAAYARTVVEFLHSDLSRVPDIMPSSVTTPPSMQATIPRDRELPPTITPATDPGERQSSQPEVPIPAGSADLATSAIIVPVPAREITVKAMLSASVDSPTLALVRNLIERLDALVKENRSRTVIEAHANELERQLRNLPRQGSIVRDGWILLGRIESGRLNLAKSRGGQVDVTRLRQLRQEAENVID